MMRLAQPIRGKVARVLNSREVAINKGQCDRVEVGMIFNILSAKGSDITDPDTFETLGTVDVPKISVKVTILHERVAVASTYRTHTVNVGGTGPTLTGLFVPPKWEHRVETLKIVDADVEELDEEEAYVHRGDPVVQVIEVVPSD